MNRQETRIYTSIRRLDRMLNVGGREYIGNAMRSDTYTVKHLENARKQLQQAMNAAGRET